MALISMTGMEFFAHHGCFDTEQVIGSHFIVDLHYETDTREAQKADDLEKTIDYQHIYALTEKEMQQKSKLLEHVAARILHAVKDTFPAITTAKVCVSKRNPPVGGKTDRVRVTLSDKDLT